MSTIQYIITDDHQIFRQGVKTVLDADEMLHCAGEAEHGKALLDLLATTHADVILLDLQMPEMTGQQALPLIRKKYPEIKILILTMHDDEQLIIHLMQEGANGYLLKNAEPEEIKTAIHAAFESGFYLNDLVSNTLLKTISGNKGPDTKFKKDIQLKEKEIEVLRLICAEHTNAEIAGIIFQSVKTVDKIRAALLDKIGVRNTAGLVIYAMKHGIVE